MNKKISIITSVILVIAMIAVTILVNKNNNDRGELTGDEKTITITISNKENQEIYNQNLETDNNYLLEVLAETEELNVITESGPYGAYITSIKGIEQGDNFYWTYYIDDEYASTGISTCEVEEGKIYSFKIEEYVAE